MEAGVKSSVYTGRSLPDTWNPDRQLYLNPDRSYHTATGVLSAGNPVRQSSHTVGFLLTVAYLPCRVFTIEPVLADQH
jgi:hypothetical protein